MGVGRQLREARETKGVTLTALANTTKIAPRQLQLLEREEYAKLPGGIFGRGYVRAVALELGLDADRLVEEFRRHQEPDAFPSPPPPEPPRPRRAVTSRVDADAGGAPRLRLASDDDPMPAARRPSERDEPPVQERTPENTSGRALVLALVVLAVIGVLWLGRDASSGDYRADTTAPAVDSGRLTRSDAIEPPSTPQVGTAGARASAEPVADPPVPPTETHDAAAPAGPPLTVTVEATGPCWVTLQADGRRLAFRMFQAGETMSATARRHVLVRAGNPSALRVTINGTQTRMRSGQQELSITPANYQRLLAAGR
jgi:cytoskeleton protein RodZ